MSTVIRPELSKRNRYWIERHRYYELKHFCLQYPIWKKARLVLDGYGMRRAQVRVKEGSTGDPTADCAEARVYYADRMGLIEKIAQETDPIIGSYIFRGVTEGLSYETLRARTSIPCCKDIYYELYRRFFWLLDKARN